MSKLGKVFFLFAGLSMLSFGVIRFLIGSWVPFLWLALGLFAGFAALSFWVDREFYKDFFSMRTTKQGMSMGALISLCFVLLIAINFFAARKYKTFDFSLAQINTLSDQSIKLMGGITEDLKIYYFYKNGSEGVDQNRRNFSDTIKRYQDISSKLKVEIIEVGERPDLVEKFEIKQAAQVIFLEYKGRKAKVEKIDEQEITSALVKVTREKDKKVYFLTGHGELGFEPKQDGSSISLLKQLLEGSRYTVTEFNFLSKAIVPADADVVFVLSPSIQLLDVEIKALEAYLAQGGSIVLGLESKRSAGLENLISKVGLKLSNNYLASVLDTPMGKAVDPRFARGSEFSTTHQVTGPFGSGQFILFKLPQSIEKINPLPAGITIDEIVKTNVDVMSFENTSFDKEGARGPFTLVSAVKGKWPSSSTEKEFNLVLLGNSDLFNEQFLYQGLNRDLALNLTAFLAREEDLISITPKEFEVSQIEMTPTGLTMFVFGFIIPLPVLLFITSGVLWYRRRYS